MYPVICPLKTWHVHPRSLLQLHHLCSSSLWMSIGHMLCHSRNNFVSSDPPDTSHMSAREIQTLLMGTHKCTSPWSWRQRRRALLPQICRQCDCGIYWHTSCSHLEQLHCRCQVGLLWYSLTIQHRLQEDQLLLHGRCPVPGVVGGTLNHCPTSPSSEDCCGNIGLYWEIQVGASGSL